MATNTIGASIAGNSSVSSRASEARPNTTNAIIVTTVMIGRLIAKSEMNMGERYSVALQLVSLQELRLTFYPLSEISNMKYARLGMIALAALTFGAMPAKAQFPHLSIMGGISHPTGDASSSQNMGYNGGIALGFSAPIMPIGIRIDAAMNHFPGKDNNV